jgi:hypothetical protein
MYPLIHMPALTDHAEQKLSAVDAELWPFVRDDIVNNRAQLFQCPDDTYLVLRIEGTELVIGACVGKNGVTIMERIVEIAHANGLSSIRFHTARRGMPRLLKQFKPVELERVYRVNV